LPPHPFEPAVVIRMLYGFGWFAALSITGCLAWLANYAFLYDNAPLSAALHLLGLACFVVMVGVLLRPSLPCPARVRSLVALPAWGGLLGAMLLAWGLWCLVLPAAVVIAVAAGVAILSFAWGALAQYLSIWLDEPWARHITLILLLLSGAAPVWLGPWLERSGAGQAMIDSVIAASPLSFLALLAGQDFLHGQWFYRHTPLGALRYDYPDIHMTAAIYVCTGLLLSIGTILIVRRHGHVQAPKITTYGYRKPDK